MTVVINTLIEKQDSLFYSFYKSLSLTIQGFASPEVPNVQVSNLNLEVI